MNTRPAPTRQPPPKAKAITAAEAAELARRAAAERETAVDMSVDAGLRRYMLAIYNKVALGLVVSSALALGVSSAPAARELLFRTGVVDGAERVVGLSVLGSLVAIAPMVVIFGYALARSRPTPARAALVYWSIVGLIGASLGVLVLTFTGASIASSLAGAAAAFGALSLYGYATRRDLRPVGSFLIVGVVGLLVALGINLFVGSAAVTVLASLAGVLIFAGLIAYDTQRLKLAYYEIGEDPGALSIATHEGALSLYINFINLFQFLLIALSGERR